MWSATKSLLQKNQNEPFREKTFHEYMFDVRKAQQHNANKYLTCLGTHQYINGKPLSNSLVASENEQLAYRRALQTANLKTKQAMFNYNELDKIQSHKAKSTLTTEQKELMDKFYKEPEENENSKESADVLENLRLMNPQDQDSILQQAENEFKAEIRDKFAELNPDRDNPLGDVSLEQIYAMQYEDQKSFVENPEMVVAKFRQGLLISEPIQPHGINEGVGTGIDKSSEFMVDGNFDGVDPNQPSAVPFDTDGRWYLTPKEAQRQNSSKSLSRPENRPVVPYNSLKSKDYLNSQLENINYRIEQRGIRDDKLKEDLKRYLNLYKTEPDPYLLQRIDMIQQELSENDQIIMGLADDYEEIEDELKSQELQELKDMARQRYEKFGLSSSKEALQFNANDLKYDSDLSNMNNASSFSSKSVNRSVMDEIMEGDPDYIEQGVIPFGKENDDMSFRSAAGIKSLIRSILSDDSKLEEKDLKLAESFQKKRMENAPTENSSSSQQDNFSMPMGDEQENHGSSDNPFDKEFVDEMKEKLGPNTNRNDVLKYISEIAEDTGDARYNPKNYDDFMQSGTISNLQTQKSQPFSPQKQESGIGPNQQQNSSSSVPPNSSSSASNTVDEKPEMTRDQLMDVIQRTHLDMEKKDPKFLLNFPDKKRTIILQYLEKTYPEYAFRNKDGKISQNVFYAMKHVPINLASGHSQTGVGLGKRKANGMSPDYQPIGKYFMSIPMLGKGVLQVVTSLGRKTPKFPFSTISKELQSVLMEWIDSGNLDGRSLTASDKMLLKALTKGASARGGSITADTRRRKRIELLKTMQSEGNDSPELQQELYQLMYGTSLK